MVELNFESFKDFAGDVGSGIKSGIESLGSARYKSGSSLTQEQMDKLENEFYQEELQRLKDMSPDSSDEDLATRAIEIAQKKSSRCKR